MFLQKPLEMQSGETLLHYVLEDCGIISLYAFCQTTGLSTVVPLKKPKKTPTTKQNKKINLQKIQQSSDKKYAKSVLLNYVVNLFTLETKSLYC